MVCEFFGRASGEVTFLTGINEVHFGDVEFQLVPLAEGLAAEVAGEFSVVDLAVSS